jgi:hypothetical protein
MDTDGAGKSHLQEVERDFQPRMDANKREFEQEETEITEGEEPAYREIGEPREWGMFCRENAQKAQKMEPGVKTTQLDSTGWSRDLNH